MKQEDPCRGVMGEVKKKGNMAVLTLVRKNMDQNQKRGSTERIESPGIARSKGADRIIGLGNLCAIVKHINAVKARGMLGSGNSNE